MVSRVPPERRRGRIRFWIAGFAVVGLLSISTIVAIYTDFLWFQEVGFTQAFWKIFNTKVFMALAAGALFLVFCLANLGVVARMRPRAQVLPRNDVFQQYRELILPYFRVVAIVGSLLLAIVLGLAVSSQWQRILLAINSVDFGTTEPIFEKDLGFFVFRLPAHRLIYGWVFLAVGLVTLIVAAGHYLTGAISPQTALQRITPAAKAHLSVLIGALALVRAWGYRLDQFNLMYSTRGEVTGGSFTDINAELPALKLLVVVSIIGAVLFLVNIRFKGWALPVAGLSLWVLTSVLAAGVYPAVIQRLRVEPAQIQKERPYIERNISATRKAYGLDAVKVSPFPAKKEITPELLQANAGTVENIRLFDPGILQRAYRQLQEFQTYYEFKDVDVDRYTIDGKPRQVMLSARELDLTNLSTSSWVTNHVYYTHGQGAVVSPTNATTPEGRPEFFTRGIPADSTAPELEIKQGGIYYGESFTDYSLVGTKEQELDYDQKDEPNYTEYSGSGGVKASGPLRRLAMAWRFKNLNLLISDLIEPETKILYRRSIRERLAASAPFLSFDADPYPVISEGRLVWMVDGFTTSDMYPYSERVDFGTRADPNGELLAGLKGQGNYIKNSVKATVDAYDGKVRLYVWDTKDPIIRAWQKAFPSLFVKASEMPESIKAHVRYPENMFEIQSHIYTAYHLTNPVDFFTRKNRWVIPADPNLASAAGSQDTQQTVGPEVQPYYVLMRLPGAATEEYVLIIPMNPRGKPNMVSCLAANSGPEDYGALTDFRFPATETVFGVGQIHSRINGDPAFSRERTLLDREGSKLEFGNLLVIPIGESLLYVQPLFLQSEQNAIPELKKVVLATEDRVVLGNSLEEALRVLTTGQAPADPITSGPSTDPGTKTAAQLSGEALEHLNRGNEALRSGDFATFGREYEEARKLLEQSADVEAGEPAPSPSP